MNTIILTLSFVLVVTVYGAEEIIIEQVLRNPFLLEVQKATENKLERRASLKLLPDNSRDGTRIDNRKQIISENTNKLNTYIDKNRDKKMVPKIFSNKKKYRKYDAPSRLMKNSVFVNSPKNYQTRLWHFKNKKDRKSIKSVFPIEKDQVKLDSNSTSNLSTNQNEAITFSGLPNNKKLEELIRKLSTGDKKNSTQKVSLANRPIDAIVTKTVLNSTQNVSLNSIKSVTSDNNNTKIYDRDSIKELGSIGLNMLSNLLGKQETEDLVNVIFNTHPTNDSNSTAHPARKGNIKNILTNFLKKKVKRDIGTFFDNNAFQELSKDNASNLSDRALKRIWRSNIASNETSQALIDSDYEDRISLNSIPEVIDTIPEVFSFRDGGSIFGILGDGAMTIVAQTAEVVIKQLTPNIIKFAYRKLSEQRLFGMIVLYAVTTVFSVIVAVIVTGVFLFAAALFTHALLPMVSSLFLSFLTPANITRTYLALARAVDNAVGVEKIFNQVVSVLLKLSRFKRELK